MTSVDPLPRLAAALSDISAQLQEISAEIRSASASTAAPQPAQPDFPPPNPVPGFAPAPPYAAAPPAPPALLRRRVPPTRRRTSTPSTPATEPAPPRATLWERMSREGAGSKVVAWIGGAVTLAGVVLLLVLAVQRGYIGPMPRVLLGAGLGVALIGDRVAVAPFTGRTTGRCRGRGHRRSRAVSRRDRGNRLLPLRAGLGRARARPARGGRRCR